MRTRRTVLAATIAPLAAPLLVASPWLISVIADAKSVQAQWSGFALGVFVALVVSYGGFLVVGIPAMLLLRRIRRLTLVPLVGVGALGGTAVFGIFSLLLGAALDTLPYARIMEASHMALFGGGLGIAVAFCFGLLAGVPSRLQTERPDA